MNDLNSLDLVVRKSPTGPVSSIDYRELVPSQAPLSLFLEYNEALGRIFRDHADTLSAQVSCTLQRIEAQTFFFDAAYRFILLVEKMDRLPEGALRITHLHSLLYPALEKICQEKSLSFEAGPRRVSFLPGLRGHIHFLIRLIALSGYHSLVALIAFLFLKKPRLSPILFISFFDYRSTDAEGRYKDPYFRPLQEYLVSHKKAYSVAAVFLGSKSFHNLKKRLRQLQSAQKAGTDVFPMERLLSPLCFLKIFAQALTLKPFQLTEPLLLRNVDLTRLFNTFCQTDIYAHNNWYFTMMHRHLAKRMTMDSRVQRLIYPFENHPWEKAWNTLRFQQKSQLVCIGFQHTSVSPKLLNHFPSSSEQQLPIFPNKILTVGSVCKDFLAELGHFPGDCLAVGCALRHTALYQKNPLMTRDEAKQADTLSIAVALSSDFQTYANLFRQLNQLFHGLNVMLHVKVHPLFLELNGVVPQLEKHVTISKESWEQLYTHVAAVLYHDNSVGVESLQYEIPSYEICFAGDSYNCLRLFQYEDPEHQLFGRADVERLVQRLRATQNLLATGRSLAQHSYVENFFKPVSEPGLQTFLQ